MKSGWIRRTIEEWSKITSITVIDPDGFDRTDKDLNLRLLTKKQFILGAMGSTISTWNISRMNGHLTVAWEKEYMRKQLAAKGPWYVHTKKLSKKRIKK